MSRVRALRPVEIALLLPWVVVVIAARLPVRDNSFLWHVTAGRVQAADGSVLTQDPFSFTRGGEPWRTQSWLAELAYTWAHDLWKLGFVPWLIAIAGALTAVAVMIAAYQRTKLVAAAAVMGVLTAWISAIYLSPRPVVVSYALFGLVVLACQKKSLAWALPLVLWTWAGIHASFWLGIGYIALDRLGRGDWRRLIRDGLASSTAVLLTAHGWAVAEFLTDFIANREALKLITEWAPPRFVSLGLFPMILGIGLLVWAGHRRTIRSGEMLIIVSFLVLAFSASRSVFPGWIAVAPFMAGGVGPAISTRANRTGRAETYFSFALAGAVLLTPFLFTEASGLDDEHFPVGIPCGSSPARTFHDDVVGGYLIYACWPEVLVFVDDRAELYGKDIFQTVLEARNGVPGWEQAFERWSIEGVLLDEDEGWFDDILTEGWWQIAESQPFVLYGRSPG